MKKVIKWVLIGVLAAVVLTVGISFAVWQYCYDGLRIGMTLEEYGQITKNQPVRSRFPYFFHEKKNGDILMVHFMFTGEWGEYVIDEMRFYPSYSMGDPDENFDEIEEGMGIYEVVELMGMPDITDMTPLSLVYEANDGTYYTIYLLMDLTDKNAEFTVAKVSMCE